MTPVTESRALSDRRTSKPRSGGEGEVGALGIGTYWFAGSVNEITQHPRPASPGSTTIVETDHPLCSCQPLSRRAGAPRASGSSVEDNARDVAVIPAGPLARVPPGPGAYDETR